MDYITKPFHGEEVLARLEKHLTLRRLQKELEEKNVRLKQEIAKQMQTEEALRKSEALLSMSQKIANIGSWELDLVADRLSWSD